MENTQLSITRQLISDNGMFISKQKDILAIKKELYIIQGNQCPLLKKDIVLEKMVIDHKHKTKVEVPTLENKLGFVRGAVEFRANAFEGKVWNFYKRLGLDKDIDFSDLLRNLANYHDNPPCTDPILHYTEVPKRERVKVSDYNRVKKYYLEMFPKKRTTIKKPMYVTSEWDQLVKQTNKYILELNTKKELDKELRKQKKLNKGY